MPITSKMSTTEAGLIADSIVQNESASRAETVIITNS
jgi:hypothetical protein